MVRKQVLGVDHLGHKPGQRAGSPANFSLTRSCPLRAQTASRRAMSPSLCLRHSTASGPSPRPSPRLPFMKRSPTRASRMVCPRPAAHLLGLIASWKAATRRASRGANPPTGEARAEAGIPSGEGCLGTHPPACGPGHRRSMLVDRKCKAGLFVV